MADPILIARHGETECHLLPALANGLLRIRHPGFETAFVPTGPGPDSGRSYIGISSWGVDSDGEVYICRLSSTAGTISITMPSHAIGLACSPSGK